MRLKLHSCRNTVTVAGLALLLAACVHGTRQSPPRTDAGTVTAADYERADALRGGSPADKVLNLTIQTYWIDDGDEFWYRRGTRDGHEFVVVDAATGARRPAFDHAALARAMASVMDEMPAPAHLPIEYFDVQSTSRIDVWLSDAKLTCNLQSAVCDKEPLVEPAADLLIAPDGTKAVFVRDDNLWLRDLAAGSERPLTDDGEPYFSFGKLPDGSLRTIRYRRSGVVLPPIGVVWSPDSTTLVATRLDERHLSPIPFVQYAPDDGRIRPVLHELRYSLIGEKPPISDYFVIDVTSGSRRQIALPGKPALSLSVPATWWRNNRYLYTTAYHGFKVDDVRFVEIDTETGQARSIIEETSDTHVHLNPAIYSPANTRVVDATNDVIWYSQRSGWGHLYRYDLQTGVLKNRITEGPWAVYDVLHIDEDRQKLYFSAGGREAGRNPYYRHIYSVDFDGSDLRLLTPEDAFHGEMSQPGPPQFSGAGGRPQPSRFSPNGRYFIDTYSKVDQPPVSVLRETDDGERIVILEKADATDLYASGWSPPESFSVKAADGTTDLYGALYRPSSFDPTRKYPVINAFYGGPQMMVTAHSFNDAVTNKFPGGQQSLAELGFIVFTMDSRGTIYRSRAFHDYAYENLDEFGLQDQIAGMRQLAERIPAMDLDRVGIYGHSFGGYGAVRAILAYPEIFKVAVSSAGVHDFSGIYHGFETLTGIPVYRGGGHVKTAANEGPENFKAMDNTALAANLEGRLLIAWSDLDENVPPHTLVPLIDALIEANKQFDMLFLPNEDHTFVTKPYFVHRKWDYFVEHLMRASPPKN